MWLGLAQWWAIRAGVTTYQHSSRIRERLLDWKALDANRGIRLWNSLSTALRQHKSSPASLAAMMTSPVDQSVVGPHLYLLASLKPQVTSILFNF